MYSDAGFMENSHMVGDKNSSINEKILEIMKNNVESIGYSEYINNILSDADIVLGPYFILDRILNNNANYIENSIMEKLDIIYKTTDSDYEYLVRNKDRIIRLIIVSIFGFFLNNSINSLVFGEITKDDVEDNVNYVTFDILFTLHDLFRLKINIDVLDDLSLENIDIESVESDIFNLDKHVFYIMSRLVTELIGIIIADSNIKKLYKQIIGEIGEIMNSDYRELRFIFNHSPIAVDVIPVSISKSGDGFLVLFMVICYTY